MAAVDPYAPCPCGSGQKFKWCCHKVEPLAEKAQRLLEGGQVEASLAALDEGLRKFPGNPWLANRKAAILIRRREPEAARTLLEEVVARNPGHVGSRSLLIRAVLEVSGPAAAAGRFQEALAAVAPEDRPALSIPAQLLGVIFGELRHSPAARMHLELALALRGGPEIEENQPIVSSLRMMEGSPEDPPWLRNPDVLSPAPASLDEARKERFAAALALADGGLWDSAAAGFELLAGDGVAEAERNLGLCRLWLGDDAASAAALGRYVATAGETIEAVDAEALRQLIAPSAEADLVDELHLIWTLRDREALKNALAASDRVEETGAEPLDPQDENSAEVDTYQILDRPSPAGEPPRTITEYPQVLGRVLVGQGIVMLEAIDDGRLDGLTAWFTDLAGESVPPAQPKTKELRKLRRQSVALRTLWALPDDLPEDLLNDLLRQERTRVIQEVWPNTPAPYLGGRTPLEASRGADPTTRVALRAAVFQHELNNQFSHGDLSGLRDRLGIADEPELDPDTVDLETLHIARLHLVPAGRLDDDRLVVLYHAAGTASMASALERAALALVDRPALLERPEVGRVSVYFDLANLAIGRGDAAEAASWLRRGRESDPEARGANTIHWDLADLRTRTRVDPPEQWVPELSVILEGATADRNNGPIILSTLIDMGLVRMVPNPDDPEDILLDSRPLQALLAEYGPRIRTSAGDLGISATRGGIWTPGAEIPAGSTTSGGIWTPGAGPPPPPTPTPSGEETKPKLIFPGR